MIVIYRFELSQWTRKSIKFLLAIVCVCVLNHLQQIAMMFRHFRPFFCCNAVIKFIAKFFAFVFYLLFSLDMSCRSRLAVLNEKLTVLERRIDYLEACVTKGETLT